MAGIYIHIPFCRQKCHYCDFYKTIQNNRAEFVEALKKEIYARKDYLQGEKVKTLYFGGGTPSALKETEVADILTFVAREFPVTKKAEVTFEANPDDLSISYLKALINAGVNRISIGLQSFQNVHLERMNRRHNVSQAYHAVQNAEKAGFTNISIDLIYGLPGLTSGQWEESLIQVFRLPVVHLSAYHLTYHEGTPFFSWLKRGMLKELEEDESYNQFNILIDRALESDFEHYEISNFAKNRKFSQHNTAYWTGEKYLGLGPSAHSFNGKSRRWNVADLGKYIRALEQNTPFFQQEQLSANDRFNEYILTNIRTQWGLSIQKIVEKFGQEKADYFLETSRKFLSNNTLIQKNDDFVLSRKGLFVSDDIMASLMII